MILVEDGCDFWLDNTQFDSDDFPTKTGPALATSSRKLFKKKKVLETKNIGKNKQEILSRSLHIYVGKKLGIDRKKILGNKC